MTKPPPKTATSLGGGERPEWRTLTPEQRDRIEDTYDVWDGLLTRRDAAMDDLEWAAKGLNGTQEDSERMVYRTILEEARARISHLDLAVFRVAKHTPELVEALESIARLRHQTPALDLIHRAITFMRKRGIPVDELQGDFKRQLAIAAMPRRPARLDDEAVAAAFDRFRTALADPRVTSIDKAGRGPKEMAIKVVEILHGASRSTLKRQERARQAARPKDSHGPSARDRDRDSE